MTLPREIQLNIDIKKTEIPCEIEEPYYKCKQQLCNVVVLPCAHLSLCHSCKPVLCPICHSFIEHTVRTYLVKIRRK